MIADPELVRFPMSGDEQFLMLSCDGIFDVMDYSDVAEFLDSCLESGLQMGQLSAALVNEAVVRGSTDDITCKIFCTILSNSIALLVDLSSNR